MKFYMQVAINAEKDLGSKSNISSGYKITFRMTKLSLIIVYIWCEFNTIAKKYFLGQFYHRGFRTIKILKSSEDPLDNDGNDISHRELVATVGTKEEEHF